MTSSDPAPEQLFECRLCGECCKGYGGTYLEPDDIAAIAAFIGIEPAAFLADYCRMSGGRPLLSQRADGYCVFWNSLCTIHAVKPRMCRRWPFIPSLLIDPKNWLLMAGVCPGMRTAVPLAAVRRCVAEKLALETRVDDRSAAAQED